MATRVISSWIACLTWVKNPRDNSVSYLGIPDISTFNDGARAPGRELMHRSKVEHYSITSSARAKSVEGTVRPSAFAVFRLITSSNLVGGLHREIGG
jgi:hypothetical protein